MAKVTITIEDATENGAMAVKHNRVSDPPFPAEKVHYTPAQMLGLIAHQKIRMTIKSTQALLAEQARKNESGGRTEPEQSDAY